MALVWGLRLASYVLVRNRGLPEDPRYAELIGDWQLARFKADPANRGQVLGGGLWTWTLVRKTGKATLERSLSRSKPGYAEYVRRTSGFVPLPPRR